MIFKMKKISGEKNLYRGNFRPLYTMNVNMKCNQTITWYKNDPDKNIENAKIFLEQNNIEVIIVEDNTCSIRATCSLGVPKVFLNKGHRFWYDPRQVSLESRRSGYMSSSNPLGILYHEIAHTKDKYNRLRLMRDNKQRASKWQIEENIKIARRVSEYATRNPIEFVAEVYAALKTGRRFDYQVMKLYNQESGKNYQRVKSFNSGKLDSTHSTVDAINR